jgi:hypothetical protein
MSRIIMLVIVFIAVLSGNAVQNKFDYLKVKGHKVASVHRLKYVASIDESFKLLGEYHHQPTYGGKMFNVSVAAFAKGDDLIMIHAEAHTDNSGGLDYSNLKPDPLYGINFTSREQCAVIAEIHDPDSIPDLRFLRERGFSPAPAMFLKQYLIASPDGSAEYVLSYGKRIASCGAETITPELKAKIERDVRALVRLRK